MIQNKPKIEVSVWVTTVLVVVLAFAGCASKGQNSPSDVVQAAYRAANECRYEEVEQYLSSGLRKKVNLLVFFGGSLEEKMDKETKKGTIKKIKIKKEEIQGERATVQFELRFEDGTSKDDDKSLIKENGEWKISG
ncbi:MAG: DUF4878 domain-containing protein [Limisphaerales bacterium]